MEKKLGPLNLQTRKPKEVKVMKKTLIIVLVLTLMLGTVSMALAADPPNERETGDGTISFQDGKTPEIIDPPDELDDWGIYSDLNLDFGLQTISGANRTYSSYEHARTDEARLAGVVVLNESVRDNYVLQVEISEFRIGDDPTMEGFELKLVPRDENTNRPTNPQVVNSVTLEADEAPQTIMTITPVSTVGANWEGFLDVLGGSVQKTGDARAEMTWSIVIPATVDP